MSNVTESLPIDRQPVWPLLPGGPWAAAGDFLRPVLSGILRRDGAM